MSDFPRFAIYYTPAADGSLAEFGRQVLGYDARTGSDAPFPSNVSTDWWDLTQDPRKYGFHATLKAPITLAPGRTEAELIDACIRFAEAPRQLPVIKPVIDAIDSFVAIVPALPSATLERLAADCVRAFEPFRAPLTPADRARRAPERLTQRQRDHLDRWGYPYVMEEFRFHMTLTGRIDGERRSAVLTFLRDRFSKLAIDRLPIDRIALFKQRAAADRFRIAGEWQLRG